MITRSIIIALMISFVSTSDGMRHPSGYQYYCGKKSNKEDEALNALEEGIKSALSSLHKKNYIGIEYHTLVYFSHDIAQAWERNFACSNGSIISFKDIFYILRADDKKSSQTTLQDGAESIPSLVRELESYAKEIKTINLLGHYGYRSKKFPWLNDIFKQTVSVQEEDSKVDIFEFIYEKQESNI